jgi:O-6-methylguanine DNA methyltransferase
MKNVTAEFYISTPCGAFKAGYSENGLAEMSFPKSAGASRPPENKKEVSAKIRGWHRATETAFKSYFDGKPARLPPLDIEGTEFQKNVWREMLKIPFGKTKSYGDIAKAVGKPKAVRAVGGACGSNPIPVFIPCHRVLAANNKIGGFSSGLGWKTKLLEIEGIEL